MATETLLVVAVGLTIINALLVHNCLKIYTEVVKYKIFNEKKKQDVK